MKRINKKINKFLKLKIFLILMSFGGYANASVSECSREYLAESIRYNNVVGVNWIIKDCKNVLSIDVYLNKDERLTSLMFATSRRNLEILKTLIAAEANLDLQNNEGKTALMYAVERGYLEIVEAFIAAGADLSIRDNKGMTALMHAAKTGNLEIVKVLYAARPDLLSIRDNDGITAIMYTAFYGRSFETVEFFIKMGADLDLQDKSGFTVLMNAVRNDEEYLEVEVVVEIVIAAGADLSIRDNDGKTALDLVKNNSVGDMLRNAMASKGIIQQDK